MHPRSIEVSEEARPFRRFDRGLLLLSFLLGGWFFLQGFSDFYRVRSSRSWPTVSGQVIHSAVTDREFKRLNGERRFTTIPDVRYVYRVESQEHLGAAITVGRGNSGGDYSRAMVACYPEGATVRVAYDPSELWRSCLEPGADHGSVARLLAAGVLSCVFWPILGFLRTFIPRRPPGPNPEIITLGLDDHPPCSPADAPPPGAVRGSQGDPDAEASG